ncbi:hypothetical protein PoB_003188600 [Plakobranchus ocellatus]|uniref:Uncharacterized protein n=1 Tax=Plakobranchus ocellatus TaxID=259542 RepID=A0AAV4A2C7_9GAST|nr:hypothetical protein PoB_003188600 [Plakobranchus ocellatus]
MQPQRGMSLALRKMTAAEVKLSPSEKAKMEEAKAKLAMLEKEEQDIKVGVYDSSYNATFESILTPVVISSSNHIDSGNVITTTSNRIYPGIITKPEAIVSRSSSNKDPRGVRTSIVSSTSASISEP